MSVERNWILAHFKKCGRALPTLVIANVKWKVTLTDDVARTRVVLERGHSIDGSVGGSAGGSVYCVKILKVVLDT